MGALDEGVREQFGAFRAQSDRSPRDGGHVMGPQRSGGTMLFCVLAPAIQVDEERERPQVLTNFRGKLCGLQFHIRLRHFACHDESGPAFDHGEGNADPLERDSLCFGGNSY
jgi:hypothetical protein